MLLNEALAAAVADDAGIPGSQLLRSRLAQGWALSKDLLLQSLAQDGVDQANIAARDTALDLVTIVARRRQCHRDSIHDPNDALCMRTPVEVLEPMAARLQALAPQAAASQPGMALAKLVAAAESFELEARCDDQLGAQLSFLLVRAHQTTLAEMVTQYQHLDAQLRAHRPAKKAAAGRGRGPNTGGAGRRLDARPWPRAAPSRRPRPVPRRRLQWTL